jgi:ATP-binding cassette subfamily C (CFTR/MRP) protein 1
LDISTISCSTLQSQLIAVPQDPFLLPGTVSYNLDPSSDHPPTLLITCLEKVGLWTMIFAQGGLDADVKDTPLSHGQQQLFCLARAMLRADSNAIIVQDEATSNMDKATNDKMREIIRVESKNHTVITIAHWVSTIMDCDVVFVLEKRRFVETGVLRGLLDKRGVFCELNIKGE